VLFLVAGVFLVDGFEKSRVLVLVCPPLIDLGLLTLWVDAAGRDIVLPPPRDAPCPNLWA